MMFNTSIQLILMKIDLNANNEIVSDNFITYEKFMKIGRIFINRLTKDYEAIYVLMNFDAKDLCAMIEKTLSENIYSEIVNNKVKPSLQQKSFISTSYSVFASYLEVAMDRPLKTRLIYLQNRVYEINKRYQLFQIQESPNEFKFEPAELNTSKMKDSRIINSRDSKKYGYDIEFYLNSYQCFFYEILQKLLQVDLNSSNNQNIMENLLGMKIKYYNVIENEYFGLVKKVDKENKNKLGNILKYVKLKMCDSAEFKIFFEIFFERTPCDNLLKIEIYFFLKKLYYDCIIVALNTIIKWVYFSSFGKPKTSQNTAEFKLHKNAKERNNNIKRFCKYRISLSEDTPAKYKFIDQILSIEFSRNHKMSTLGSTRDDIKFKGADCYMILPFDFCF